MGVGVSLDRPHVRRAVAAGRGVSPARAASSIACSGSTPRQARGAIASEPGDYWQVRLSPDDRQAAVTMLEPLLRTLDVYVLRGGSGAPVPVTLGLAADTDPVWSPDGRTLLFRSVRNGQARLFTREVGITGAAEDPLLAPAADAAFGEHPAVGVVARRRDPVFRNRGIAAEYGRISRCRAARVSRRPRSPPASTNRTHACRPTAAGWRMSRTKRASPTSTCRGGPRARALRVSQAGGSRPRWAGASLYFLRGRTKCCAPRRTPSATPAFDVPQRVLTLPGIRDFDVSHAGNRLLAIVPAASDASARRWRDRRLAISARRVPVAG